MFLTLSFKILCAKCQPYNLSTLSTLISCVLLNERNKKLPSNTVRAKWILKKKLSSWLRCVSLSFLPLHMSQKPDLSQTPIHPIPLETGSVIWQGSGPQSGRAGAERAAEERHVINGSYLEVVALGSWLCFPPITLAGRKMGRGGNGWNSIERGTDARFHLVADW